MDISSDNRNQTTQPKAIVIGAGVGGLAISIRLAIKGYDVKVFERNEGPGGKIGHVVKDGFVFDSGPSLFTEPQNIEELFSLAGEPIEEYFRYRKLPQSCRYFFENGKILNAYADQLAFSKEMETVLGEDPKIVLKYLSIAKNAYKNIGNIFLGHSLHKLKTWLGKGILSAIASTRTRYLTETFHEYNQKYFRSAEAVQIFDRFATYNGSNPFSAPAMLSMISNLEQNEGSYYPEGGMISISSALYALAIRKGVRFYFSTPVQEIVHSKGKVKGIVVKNNLVVADKVISNLDVYYAYRDLLKDESRAENILKRERSSSALIFYWGMKKEFPVLDLHNIFFSRNYEEEFQFIFQKKKIYSDPTIYVNITSKMEKGFCPEGKENWFVMINVPANEGQDWQSVQQVLKQSVINKLNRMMGEDISSCIETEHILDPSGIEERTLSHMGSLYGNSSNSLMSAFLRHPNFVPHIKGVFFTGGSVHPGGGIPLSLKSAKIVDGFC